MKLTMNDLSPVPQKAPTVGKFKKEHQANSYIINRGGGAWLVPRDVGFDVVWQHDCRAGNMDDYRKGVFIPVVPPKPLDVQVEVYQDEINIKVTGEKADEWAWKLREFLLQNVKV
ncbi:hypothetical protein Lumi_088 [Xylophilus phage Lumi]|nr:hypothetical protein Lumi_088 [Xylophilus phage Lumi]